MGWDQRGYYYRVRKVNGRVVRDYVGPGIVGELAAESDGREREKRTEARAAEKAERDRLDAHDASVDELGALADLLATAAALHGPPASVNACCGEWRKQRGRNEDPPRAEN